MEPWLQARLLDAEGEVEIKGVLDDTEIFGEAIEGEGYTDETEAKKELLEDPYITEEEIAFTEYTQDESGNPVIIFYTQRDLNFRSTIKDYLDVLKKKREAKEEFTKIHYDLEAGLLKLEGYWSGFDFFSQNFKPFILLCATAALFEASGKGDFTEDTNFLQGQGGDYHYLLKLDGKKIELKSFYVQDLSPDFFVFWTVERLKKIEKEYQEWLTHKPN